jgi:hypothetical protein
MELALPATSSTIWRSGVSIARAGAPVLDGVKMSFT